MIIPVYTDQPETIQTWKEQVIAYCLTSAIFAKRNTSKWEWFRPAGNVASCGWLTEMRFRRFGITQRRRH